MYRRILAQDCVKVWNTGLGAVLEFGIKLVLPVVFCYLT